MGVLQSIAHSDAIPQSTRPRAIDSTYILF